MKIRDKETFKLLETIGLSTWHQKLGNEILVRNQMLEKNYIKNQGELSYTWKNERIRKLLMNCIGWHEYILFISKIVIVLPFSKQKRSYW